MRNIVFVLMVLTILLTAAPVYAQGGAAATSSNWAVPLAAGLGMAIASGLCGLGQGKATASAAAESGGASWNPARIIHRTRIHRVASAVRLGDDLHSSQMRVSIRKAFASAKAFCLQKKCSGGYFIKSCADRTA